MKHSENLKAFWTPISCMEISIEVSCVSCENLEDFFREFFHGWIGWVTSIRPTCIPKQWRYGAFHRDTPGRLDGFMENHGKSRLQMDDDWGSPYFRTPPYMRFAGAISGTIPSVILSICLSIHVQLGHNCNILCKYIRIPCGDRHIRKTHRHKKEAQLAQVIKSRQHQAWSETVLDQPSNGVSFELSVILTSLYICCICSCLCHIPYSFWPFYEFHSFPKANSEGEIKVAKRSSVTLGQFVLENFLPAAPRLSRLLVRRERSCCSFGRSHGSPLPEAVSSGLSCRFNAHQCFLVIHLVAAYAVAVWIRVQYHWGPPLLLGAFNPAEK